MDKRRKAEALEKIPELLKQNGWMSANEIVFALDLHLNAKQIPSLIRILRHNGVPIEQDWKKVFYYYRVFYKLQK